MARRPIGPRPLPPPLLWQSLIGHYGPDAAGLCLCERSGTLQLLIAQREHCSLSVDGANRFVGHTQTMQPIVLFIDPDAGPVLTLGQVAHTRRRFGPVAGTDQLTIEPLRPVADVLAEALHALPPLE